MQKKEAGLAETAGEKKTYLAAAAEYLCAIFEEAVNASSGKLEIRVDLHDCRGV